MPRADPTIDPTDAERRELIALIRAGLPRPEKYRFMLFEDKRKVAMVWNGTTPDVCTTVLPFQALGHMDEPPSAGSWCSTTSRSSKPRRATTRRTRRADRKLELKTAPHGFAQTGRCQVAVRVIDIFGNDTMALPPVSAG